MKRLMDPKQLMNGNKITRLLVCALLAALLAGHASADIKYLYQNVGGVPILDDHGKPSGADLSINGAFFSSTNLQSTGTGVLQPFLKMHSNDSVESGYNTDEKHKVLDDVPAWTSSLRLGDLADVMSPEQVLSKQFLLDFDHTGTQPPFMQLTDLQIRVGDNLANYAGAWSPAGSSLIYDMDGAGDTTVQMDYRLDPGSGGGDMWVYVPSSLFTGSPDTNVLLYSKFAQNNDGPEEWAAAMGEGTVVPLPGAVLLGMLGIGAAGWRMRRFA